MGKEKISPVTDKQWADVCDFNREIAEEYLLESVDLSDKSLRQYKSGVRIWLRWVKDNLENKQITDIKSLEYKKYQNYLVRQGLSSSAVRFKRTCVSNLNDYILTYYEEEFPTFRNFVTKKIKVPPKAFVHKKEPLNEEELEQLVKYLEEKEEWQKLAYLLFTYSTGCRREESRQLLKEVADYEIIEKQRKVKNKKGIEEIKTVKYYLTHDIRCKGKSKVGKVRQLKFDERSMKAIKKWLEIRGEDDCPYVFATKYGGRMKQVHENTFNRWCHDCFEICIKRRIHPHLFRESRATNLVVGEGRNIETAQSLLGHESSETTQIYVIRDTSEDADDAFI